MGNVELDRREILGALTRYFNEEELRTLCFELAVDHDSLPGEGHAAKARELVERMERHGGVLELIDRIVQLRPNAYWREKLVQASVHAGSATEEIPLATLRAVSGRTGPLREENRLLFSMALARANERLDKTDAALAGLMLSHRTLVVVVAVAALFELVVAALSAAALLR